MTSHVEAGLSIASFVHRSPSEELARLNTHFVRVLRSLEESPPPRLSRAQQRARSTHLGRLERYRRRARFPKNRRFPGKYLPHFIDDVGTRCAMAHLIETSGEQDLVQRVARERNYARVRELARMPELARWLETNGLSLDEAARIQPRYCGSPAQNCLCGFGGYSGLEGTLSTGSDGGLMLTVTATYGSVPGVTKGDVLPAMDTRGVGTAFDVVFATLGGDGKTAFLEFGSSHGEVLLPATACSFPQVASIPGPLPLATLKAALSSPTEASCQKVLTDYDPAWGVIQGGPDCNGGTGGSTGSGGGNSTDAGTHTAPSRDDGGCSVALHSAHSAGLAVAISAAYLAYTVRRSQRR